MSSSWVRRSTYGSFHDYSNDPKNEVTRYLTKSYSAYTSHNLSVTCRGRKQSIVMASHKVSEKAFIF